MVSEASAAEQISRQSIPLRAATAATCGNKAGVLGDLLRAGYPVPDGFVIEARVAPSRLGDIARDIVSRLGGGPVAVRSSATIEDLPDRSFAGQLETTLAVRETAEIVEAVQRCRDSLNNARATAYRHRVVGFQDEETSAHRDRFGGLRGEGSVDGRGVGGSRDEASVYRQRIDGSRGEGSVDRDRVGGSPGEASAYWQGIDGFRGEALVAVLVQSMVAAEASGVLFTRHPVTAEDVCVVESAWGLGESVVSGRTTPDRFLVREDTIEVSGGAQRTRLDAGAHGVVVNTVAEQRPSLTDAQVRELVALGYRIAAHLGAPQDIEWALAGNQFWVLQSRPITGAPPDEPARRHMARDLLVTGVPQSSESARPAVRGSFAVDVSLPDGSVRPAAHDSLVSGVPQSAEAVRPAAHDSFVTGVPQSGEAVGLAARDLLVTGVPGSNGVAAGRVRLVRGVGDFPAVRPGDVIVCRTTDPAWTVLFGIAAAVVTETGGILSHAAIVARECGIPAVLAAEGAMAKLTNDQVVSVDGTRGQIHAAG
ncbi:PEP/pyruvate-binding domain-containing protein [Nocardia sp. NPDC052566]|uniref:PEP/pyruvate-binding domain-containing protein n=1 Tax=Nocardia sp. NPDC052566 TaxID=3364330 RepID=UPI0037C7CE7C